MAAKTRRQYAGGAAQTSLVTSITAVATAASIASTTGWPSAAGVPFYVVIDPDTSIEEKCLVTISGSSLTMTRGQDGTSAAAHDSGATIYPVFTATDADEANELASKFTAKGDIVTQGASTFTTTTVGTNDQLLKADSSAAGGVAWATYSPTITLGGDLSGSATLTNLGNATLTATVAANSVALGTDTTGNYVATITGTTNQVSVSGSGSETAAVTLSTPQDIHTGATPTFAGGVFTGSSSGDLLRITQTGTGNALLVEDSTNPDSTPFVVDASGRLVVGHTSSLVVSGTQNAPVQLHTSTTNQDLGAIASVSWNNGGTQGAQFTLSRSRGGTIGTNTVVQTDDSLGRLGFVGADGTGWAYGAAVRGEVDATPSTGIIPGRITFSTASSAGTLTERMRIDSAGLTTITGTAVITSNASSDALRITQTGTGNALLVEDSANPDSTPFVVDASGRVVVGATTAATTRISATTITAPLQILGTTNATASSLFGRYSNDVTAPNICLAKSRDTSIGSFTTVAAADQLGVISFAGADGTQMVEAARITVLAEGTVSTGVVPGLLTFNTASSAGTLTERMRMTSTGFVGIGTSTSTGRMLGIGGNKTGDGGTSGIGVLVGPTWQSDITSVAYLYQTFAATQAASYTLNDLVYYSASQGTFGAGSTVTNQYGFYANSNITGATNNYGFFGNIASGTGRYNLYMAGTADNYLAGSLGIGITPTAGRTVTISKTMTGAVSSFAVLASYQVASDVISTAESFRSNPNTAAASFTLANLIHFKATQAAIGAGSAVTTQYGFWADSTMTGATTNIGYFGNLAASAAARWNLYMDGTAPNYMLGRVGIGALLSSGAMAQITNTTAADDVLIIKGAASQTARYLDIKNSAGTSLWHINSSNSIGHGVGTATTTGFVADAGLVAKTSSAFGPQYVLGNKTNDTSAPYFILEKDRADAVVQSNDVLGNLVFRGYDGTNYRSGASIEARVDGTPGTNDMPGRLVFSTTADGASTVTERMRIDNAGNLGVNMTTFSGAKVVAIGNGTAPTVNPTGGGYLYVESGALKYRGSSGTVTTIANA